MGYLKTIQDRSIYKIKKKPKPKKKNVKRQHRTDLMKQRAETLNKNLPKSEQWFQDLYAPHAIDYEKPSHNDRYNVPIRNRYIADVVNYKYMYVIEVDGSYHDRPDQVIKDKYKDYFLKKHGFKVFRIKAFDLNNYNQILKEVLEYRASKRKPQT